jgi:hypothetical protein
MLTNKIEIAIIAAPEDEVHLQRVLTAIEGVLQFVERKELVSLWHRGMVPSGSITSLVIAQHIQTARIILLLMSPDLLADRFYNDPKNHMAEIIEQSKQKDVQVIPVLIRPSSWKYSPFKMLEPQPANEVPLIDSPRKDQVLQKIAEVVLAPVKNMLEAISEDLFSRLDTDTLQEEVQMSASSFIHGHALLIGVGGDLPVTVDEAQRLEKVLVNATRAAYPSAQVELLLENRATRDTILAAFDRLIQKVNHDPDATVIVYFSGHGGKFSGDGTTTDYFLLPHGYNPALRHETAISDHELTAKIEAIQARKLLVLLDCCHAGGIPQLKNAGERFEMSALLPELLQALASGGGRVVLASSQEGETSQTDSAGSIFTHCLLEALRGKGATHSKQEVRIFGVLDYLFQEVPRRTNEQQHPFLNKILNMNENFILCYAPGQRKGTPDEIIASDQFYASPSLMIYQRGRLETKRAELQSSLDLYDAKVTLLRQEINIETHVLRKFQYQQQLLQALRERTSLEEDLETLLRQSGI